MRITIFSLALVVASAAGAEDLTIISKVTHDGGPAETATSYIASDHFRISQPDGSDAIFDLKSGDMTLLNAKKKTYSVITQKEIDDMAAMRNEQMDSPEMKEAQEQMKNLPPEMQKRMEAVMGGMFKVDAQKTGTRRTIAGLPCDDWTVTIGQMSTSEQCLTTELKMPAQAWDKYKKYADTMKSMMAAFGPMARSLASMKEQFAKMKGYPLANTTTTNIMGRKSVSTSEVTALKYGPVPSSAWVIPAGYKQVESPMKQAMTKRGR